MEKKLDQIEDLCPSILIYLEHSNFGTDFKISENEIDALNTFLRDIMEEIDVLSTRIEAVSPPRSINLFSQENYF